VPPCDDRGPTVRQGRRSGVLELVRQSAGVPLDHNLLVGR
jgi:hypothetical protein